MSYILKGNIKCEGKFLYSAVSSPQDRSKRFTLYDILCITRHYLKNILSAKCVLCSRSCIVSAQVAVGFADAVDVRQTRVSMF